MKIVLEADGKFCRSKQEVTENTVIYRIEKNSNGLEYWCSKEKKIVEVKHSGCFVAVTEADSEVV